MACGRLGDARLATCEALRLAPKDGTIKALQKELQQELFAGCSALGEALDALEDFNRSPEETKRAAQVVKDMLLSDVKEDVLRAFMASAGSKTIFRRQNAMGDNWQEEARNGTMSLLSEITKAGPQLEEELVRLNQEAEALEGTCSTAGCDDPHAMSKAQDSKLDRQKVPPPPAPPEEEGFSGISKSRRKRKGQGLRKDEPAEAAEPAEPSQGIAVSLPAMSTKATDLLFSFGPLRALAVAAAVAQDWAKAASRFGENDADPSTVKIRQASWLRWAEILCRGVAVDLQIASPMMGKQLLKHLVTTPEKVEASKTVRCSMSTWSFILEIWRDDRRLWTTCLTGAHALPGFLEEICHPQTDWLIEAAEEPGQSLRLWSAFPTCYERMDVLLPGEARRSTLAGVTVRILLPSGLNVQEPLDSRSPWSERVRASVAGVPVGRGRRSRRERKVLSSRRNNEHSILFFCMSASSDGAGSIRYFSGEAEDHKEYRRWKLWLLNKFQTLDKLPKDARGSFLFTCLSGKALETVEHLDPKDYQKEGGEEILLSLLDTRFPQRDDTDELAEVLQEVFSLRARDGETLRSWISRASDLFDRCERKSGVKFPDEARGFMLLKWSGLNEEQQAVVKGRSLGVLKKEEISRAMRSCYPDYVVGRKKAIALVQDDMEQSPQSDPEVAGFDDIELFLADHEMPMPPSDTTEFPEDDVAEVLAASWKEKRAEIARLQKSRRFDQARDLKRSFRVEIEEMKRKTKCNRCGRLGHWARECRQKRDPTMNNASQSSSLKPATRETGASYVAPDDPEVQELPQFVASVGCQQTLLQQLHERQALCQTLESDVAPEVSEIFLVSSPGFAVLDSGCGKTIIGEQTLKQFQQLWQQDGRYSPEYKSETNFFNFGNGDRETSSRTVIMPIGLAGRYGTIQAAIVRGDAPLLLSRPALKRLGAVLNFDSDRLCLFSGAVSIDLVSNAAGQYVLNVMDFPKNAPKTEVHMVSEDAFNTNQASPSEFQELISMNSTCSEDHNGDSGVTGDRITEGDKPSDVCCPAPSPEGVSCPCPKHPCPCHAASRIPVSKKAGGLTKKQTRSLESQVKTATSKPRVGQKYAVVEVFCPPRFVPEVERMGLRGLSLDTSTGWDLNDARQQEWVETELGQHPPELLVICPPCTDAGGWFHLNALRMPIQEVLRRRLILKKQKAFCKRLMRQQFASGGRVLFEHPSPSCVWDDPDFVQWCEEYHSFVTHMCCYDLHVPATSQHPKQLIRKSTRLLCSHTDMCVLRRNCPGASDPNHACHRQVSGSEPGLGSVSTHAGRYTPQFVSAVLNTVPKFKDPAEILCCTEDACVLPDHSVFEALSVVEESDPEKLKGILLKLHKNLGHPHNNDLVRLLRHGNASDTAIKLARSLTCPFCQARQQPAPANPGKVSSVSEFNQRVGLDVKYLPGWRHNQKVPALNIVDHATSFQFMVPFFEVETSHVLRKLYLEKWVQWAGPPKEVILDPARTNLGQAMVNPTELEGTHVHVTAAGAHWQLGKTEVHGGWFNRVLTKVLAEREPQSKEDWLECVMQSHVKNQMIQNYGFTPSQRVFGRNPEMPGDLMNEPVNVVSGTASLQDQAVAKAQAVRLAARKAVLALQDDKILKRALLARPRRDRPFASGDVVAYWRDQKWSQGVLSQGGKWYGSGVVIGLIGRNVIIAHRNHIIRCAPEQVRLATSEEKTLIETPGTELLGIKDMIESGTFRSSQYVDLLSQSYPPQEEAVIQEGVGQSQPVVDAKQVPSEVEAQAKPSVESVDKSPDMSSSFQPSSQESIFDDPPEKTPDQTMNVPEATVPTDDANSAEAAAESASSYGPVRRARVPSKSGPLTMFRPSAMKHDDFVEVMQEVVPQLIEDTIAREDQSASDRKRPADVPSDEPDPKIAKSEDSALLVEHAIAYVASADCSKQESRELWNTFKETKDNAIEVFIQQYFNKRAQKEIPASRNEPLLQARVDQAKVAEWQTLLDKGAVRIVPAKESSWILKHKSDRIMGSRFVIVKKPEEDIVENGGQVDPSNLSHWKVKARWCLQGHLDPDLSDKASSGRLQSPTLSQMGRTALFQLMASKGWLLQLGGIKGAFLEAGPIPACYRPLFARLPAGGIPGVDHECLIEILGNVYGQNDAPAAWYKVFDTEVIKAGFERSKFDNCLYWMRENGKLTGALGAHVDDTATGGMGPKYLKALEYLKTRFPYRKWRTQEGEFCGSHYRQEVSTGVIHMSQRPFAEALKPAYLPNSRKQNRSAQLDPKEISVLRGINGSLGWLSSQSRPDLAAQTSLSQQCFPSPTVHHLIEANNVIHRAKQFAEMEITFQAIPVEQLKLCVHSDAAFANVGDHTQGGFVIGFSTVDLDNGLETSWTPAVWRSFKLSRAVGSTLAAEAQAMVAATGTLEWMALLLAEAIDGISEVREYVQHLKTRPPVIVTDWPAQASVELAVLGLQLEVPSRMPDKMCKTPHARTTFGRPDVAGARDSASSEK
eukprot:s180_g15.t1